MKRTNGCLILNKSNVQQSSSEELQVHIILNKERQFLHAQYHLDNFIFAMCTYSHDYAHLISIISLSWRYGAEFLTRSANKACFKLFRHYAYAYNCTVRHFYTGQ